LDHAVYQKVNNYKLTISQSQHIYNRALKSCQVMIFKKDK
jgi:hypothetical protein